jgi:hypothetical protein
MKMCDFIVLMHISFANRTLSLRETSNSTKYPKKQKLQWNSLDALCLQLPDRVDGVPPLPL